MVQSSSYVFLVFYICDADSRLTSEFVLRECARVQFSLIALGLLTQRVNFMENIAHMTFRDCSTTDEAAFEDLEKSRVQNEAFNRIRRMFTRYSEVSV